MQRIAEAYNKLIQSDDYKNFERNLKIAEGKTKEGFKKSVEKRIKLEYAGTVDRGGNINSFVQSGKGLSTASVPLSDLIVGNNILQNISKIYSEMSADKKPIVETNFENVIEGFNLDEEVGKLVFTNSYSGSVLLKGVYHNDTISFYAIKRKNFFCVYDIFNPGLVEKIVVYEYKEKDKKIEMEIYLKGKTEYRTCTICEESWLEIQTQEIEGMAVDGLGYSLTYDGWQVAMIGGYSDYNEDIISNALEIVVNDTSTSQAFNRCLNPILQVPDSMIEYDNNNVGSVKIDDRIVVLRPDDKELKQVQMETKIADWNIQRENLLNNIYFSTGVNKNVLGLMENGGVASSGYAMERSLQRIVSVVNYKRNKCYKALETVITCGAKFKKKNFEIKIIGDDILNKSSKEKLEEKGIENEKLSKLADVFIKLNNSSSDVEMQNMVIELGDKIKESLKLELGGE